MSRRHRADAAEPMSAGTEPARWSQPLAGSQGATVAWLDALSSGACTPETFLSAMRDQFRGDSEEGWEVLEPDTFHRVHVRGETRFVVRLAVLFGNDFGFSVEQLSWRRRDGRGPGVSLTRPDPNQLSLL